PTSGALASLHFAFPSSACPAGLGPAVTGSGASSANGAMNRWGARVCRAPYGQNISYTLKNSVAGDSDFVNGLVDYGITSIPLSATDQATLRSAGRTYAYAPMTLSGLVFGFNIHDRFTGEQITSLKLTPDLLAELFTGQILNWQNPAIEALNPGVN